MNALVDATVIGLFGAAPLVLAAVGFTLIYYLNGFINVAYGENVTVGAFVAVVFNTILGWNFYLTIVPSAVIAGLLSVATFVLVFRPAMRRGVGPTEMIILSVGLSFFIRFGLRVVFGIKLRLFDTGKPAYLDILGIGITDYQVAALVLAAVVVVGLYLFIFRTGYGEQMRALAGNRDLAKASGINPNRVSLLIWFIAGVSGGLAGIFYGVFSFVNADIGWNLILVVIMISILGRVGSVRGALVVGVGAGIIVALVTSVVSQALYAQVVLLLLFIAVLKVTRTAPAMRG
jgi:branched-subunit amino acid ABC-type transport system permease component